MLLECSIPTTVPGWVWLVEINKGLIVQTHYVAFPLQFVHLLWVYRAFTIMLYCIRIG